MTPQMHDATRATLVLAVYTLSQHGVYTKQMITFKGDFHCDVEVPLCLYERPGGVFEVTADELHLQTDIPEEPDHEPEEEITVRTLRITDEVSASASVLALHRRPPTLPENPTAEQRWQYLLDVVKNKG